MQKIIPHLWYDKQAVEAAEFYTQIFSDGPAQSKITHKSQLRNTPSGDTDIVSFDLWGFSFMAISAGPYFKFNPSISIMVNFDPSKDENAKDKIEVIWNKLLEGGKALMPLDAYPFSERYGWVQDKFGLTWQLIFTNPAGEERPPIIPALLFTGPVAGKAEQASDFYISVFKNSKRGMLTKYTEDSPTDKAGTVMFTDFMLEGQWFAAMDSDFNHGFNFNEAVSLLISCQDQSEIDYYWEKLSAVPEAEQCGWLKDSYGVSWQVSPSKMTEIMSKGTPTQIDNVTQAFLKMKKFDLKTLEEAYQNS